MVNHTFAICAYKESKYLEHCVRSILNQSITGKVIMCTSTPCKHISSMAEKYNIPLYVRQGQSDIRDDWNFAYDTADTELVTIAHQDDIYHKDYTRYMLETIGESDYDNMSIYLTGYRPLKNGRISLDANCILRGVLRLPLRLKCIRGSIFAKRAVLSLGNSICCPTVTYNKAKLGKSIFTSDMPFNIDWDTFYKLAELDGEFVYQPKSLVLYRVHEDATSKEFIDNDNRFNEDWAMFRKFWPEWVVKIIMKFYVRAYDTYN